MRKPIKKVDCTNDAEMISLGIRPNHLVGRDQSVWTKTEEEKEILKKHRHYFSNIGKGCSTSVPFSPINGKLIIYTQRSVRCITNKNLNHIPKSTYSYTCNQTEISNYLRNFGKVVKYSWNGKIYSPNELPIPYGRKRIRK